tara:strand:+ start:4726 stop:5853 length:1128 start_codon:yes stop_codon:yes gene_type:complete
MIITSLEKTNALGPPTNIRVIRSYETGNGEMFYEYEISFSISTDALISENLSFVTMDAYDVMPRGALDKKLLTQRKIDFGKANKRMLSSVGKGVEENLSNNAVNYRQPSGFVTREITDTLGAGRITTGGPVQLGRRNVIIKDAILNFPSAIQAGPVRKRLIKPIASDNISLFSNINSQLRETIRSATAGMTYNSRLADLESGGNNTNTRRRRGSRNSSIPSSLSKNVNTSYILESFDLVMQPLVHRDLKVGEDYANLTTVIDYRTSVSLESAYDSSIVDYEKDPISQNLAPTPLASSVAPSNFRKYNNERPEGVSGPDTQKGDTFFTRGFREACLRAIFEYGIPPTSLYGVRTDSSIVSPMQNYQGTSRIKSNGY